MTQYLYRFWDRDKLLYVGISINAYARAQEHKRSSAFYPRATHVTFEYFSSREEVEAAERIAIQTEDPIYNVLWGKRLRGATGAELTSLDEEHVRVLTPSWEQIQKWLMEHKPRGDSVLRRMIDISLSAERARNVAIEQGATAFANQCFSSERSALNKVLKWIAEEAEKEKATRPPKANVIQRILKEEESK